MPEWDSRQETPCTDRTPRTKGSAPFPLIIKAMARSKIQHMSVVASVYSKKGGHVCAGRGSSRLGCGRSPVENQDPDDRAGHHQESKVRGRDVSRLIGSITQIHAISVLRRREQVVGHLSQLTASCQLPAASRPQTQEASEEKMPLLLSPSSRAC